MGGEADFIIVGAGSSGCVLANRLSASGRHRVALIEAGPSDRNFWIHLPIGYGKTMWHPLLNWRFSTEPEPNMKGRRIYWPRGRVLGGSSAINGLIAIRGQKEDYDRWRTLGNPGWGFSDVLPYFRKLESNAAFPDDQLHGQTGPVTVSKIAPRHPLIDAFIGAAERVGIPYTEDFNGAAQEGAGYYQLTTRKGWRASAATAYLRPARGRANLDILTDAQVTGLIIEGKRAQGVHYHTRAGMRELRARRGVILSAGAIQSPQLLMLSGIGPAAHLREIGLDVLIDRPSVGANLQDHLQARLIYRASKPITTNDAFNSLLGRARMTWQFIASRSGPLAIGINQGGLFARALSSSATPDVQFHVATLSADMAGGKVHDFSGFTTSVCQLRPESRGHIRLDSGDPLAAPLMSANYLATETDRQCIVAGLRLARRIAKTAPLRELVASEVLPGLETADDSALLDFVRENGATIFHPSGTCRMGSDDEAVADPRLRVCGIDRLWVADCSIMPTLVSGNTNIPAIMIGEKASDMILEDCERGR